MGHTVSVIIPTYNVERLIADSIKSALDQTHRTLEILVVDDASTDCTLDRVKRLGDPRLRWLRNDINRGPSYSRNRAIDEAQGEWLALLDGDDGWTPERLERLVAIAEEQGSDLVADDIALANENLHPSGMTALGKRRVRIKGPERVSPARFVRWDLGFMKPLIRRRFLVEKGIRFDESLRHGEDFELMWRCLCRGARFDLVPEAYYLHRTRQGSLSSERVQHFDATREVTVRLLAEPAVVQDAEVSGALGDRLRRIDRTLAYNRCRNLFNRGESWRGFRLLVRNPGALLFALQRLLVAAWRRCRRPQS